MIRINNRGSALLIVLLTITLIGIFAPVILSIVLSGSAQADRVEENMQTRHVAEMGIEHYRIQTKEDLNTLIEEYVNNNDNVTNEDIVQYICGFKDNTEPDDPKLSDFNLSSPSFTYDGYDFTYQVETINEIYDENENSIEDCAEYDSLILQFIYRSLGKMSLDTESEAKAETTITGPVLIDLSSSGSGGDSGDGGSGDGSNESTDDRVFHDEEEFDQFTDESTYPEISDDIEYTETTSDNIEDVTNPHLTEEDIEFSGDTDIQGSLLVDNDSEIDTHGTLTIEEHATFSGFTELNNHSGLEIGGNASFSGATFNNHSDMTIGGDASFTGTVIFKQHTTSIIHENAVFHESFIMENHSTVHIGRNMYVSDVPTVSNTGTDLTIGGSAKFESGLDNRGDITIEGNAFFGEDNITNTGILCVKGRIEGIDEQRVQEVNECGNGSGSGIYALNQDVSSPSDDGDDWNIDFGENDY